MACVDGVCGSVDRKAAHLTHLLKEEYETPLITFENVPDLYIADGFSYASGFFELVIQYMSMEYKLTTYRCTAYYIS